jgi:hypothetical protein
MGGHFITPALPDSVAIPALLTKLAKRYIVPLSLWERARREGNGHVEPLFHHPGQWFDMSVKTLLQ